MQTKCRFCQTRATSQSAAFLKCTSSTGSTPTPAVTAASTSTTCSNVVSRSGLEGISYITDSRCNVASPTLLGCSARTSCRLCRNFKNEANQYLVSCQVLNALRTESADAGSASSSSGNKGKTESVATGSSASGSHVKSTPVKNFAVTTENSSSVPGPKKSAGTPLAVPVAAAVVAVVMVMMMSVIYGKYRRDKYDNDIMTPDDCPMDDLVTPNSGPRHGSLVMVVSESSIATL
ncbi:hypothetical protein PHYBOEH_002800 [Phytophthora boehmeriae]|uniref:Uncharacterized protein n=1 Tax=Phytophthora boehmeriae TaxID=109152 RepID=A0A8T1WV30_9STRA|nr:hypothetical protein PHYBOEH_002800 [Phytophthora boehmeriae]